jgi:hypothetical protein
VLYVPTVREAKMVSLLLLPIPEGLLNYLDKRGLGIWVLPKGKEAEKLAYGHLNLPRTILTGVELMPHEHPHYDVRAKSIIIPMHALQTWEHNVLIHEIGHAVDYLYSDHGQISMMRPFKSLLNSFDSLDSHCEKQDSLCGGKGEQFATCFEAFFSEPIHGAGEFLHNIDDLSPEIIRAFQKHMVDPFKAR